MRVIKPSYEIYTPISPDAIEELRTIEVIGRSCYHSEDKITDDGESAKKFIARLIKNGHESVLEHSILTVKFIIDRGISHEIVRHRLCAFTQESTRYCNYANALCVIEPEFFTVGSDEYVIWWDACSDAESHYDELISKGATPEQARTVLPSSTATVLWVSTNYREWRHIFKLRTPLTAHQQMREIMRPLLAELKERIPIIFDDISQI